MKKSGFTLTELMMVITITGVLTATAVPKLAGSISKAKAGEIPPAAASYTKLQAAYLYENKAFGTWKRIGYKAPGNGETNTFSYSKGDIEGTIKKAKITTELGGDGKITWQAENKIALSGCQKGNVWKIRAISTSNTDIEFKSFIEPSASSNNCIALANDWGNFQSEISMNTPPTETVVAEATPGNTTPAGGSGSGEGSTPSGSTTPSGQSNNGNNNSENTPQIITNSNGQTMLAQTFVDKETGLTEDDDGSCGVMVTSAGNTCPPSWCKLNGNVSKNHGGWANSGHKWNECYAARQDLIQEAADKGLLSCTSGNGNGNGNGKGNGNGNGNNSQSNCKVIDESVAVVIKGKIISSGTSTSTASNTGSSTGNSTGSKHYEISANNKNQATDQLGETPVCAEDKEENKCKTWGKLSECETRSSSNSSCTTWKV